MTSEKSLYWLAIVVIALGLGTRYGKSDKDWVACVVDRTSNAVDRVTDHASSGVEGVVVRLNDRQECVNDRVQAAVDRVQARIEKQQAMSEARAARVNAIVTRVNSKVAKIDIENDFSLDNN